MSLRKKLLALMAVPVVVILATTAFAMTASRRAAAELADVQHAYEVRDAVNHVLTDLMDAETGTRGYVLTGDIAFLDPYRRGANAITTDLASLGAQIGDDPTQRQRYLSLTPHVAQRFEVMREVQGFVVEGGTQVEIARLLNDGREISEDLRRILLAMDQHEIANMDRAQAARDQTAATADLVQMFVLPGGMLAALLLVAWMSGRLVHRIRLVEENAERLVAGEELADPDMTRDEVGGLSRRVVETGTRVMQLQEELRRMATVDPLTGVANRRGFLPIAEYQLKMARREGRSLALVFTDIDGLKDVNDRLGHAVGDLLIQEAAAVLRDTLRGTDLIARIGGDEFCVLLTGNSALEPDVAVRRLLDAVAWADDLPDRDYPLSLSVGVATVQPEQQDSLEQLIARADALMYQHKRTKRVATA